jgi:hypothetical protein
VVVGFAGLSLVGVIGVVLWLRQPRPCRATFEQVREGMTYDEVCATVGGPQNAGLYWDPLAPGSDPGEAGQTGSIWDADDVALVVGFGADGRSRSVRVRPRDAWEWRPSLLDRLRDRLGL